MTTMKAIVQNEYGRPDVLSLADVAKPEIEADDQVLVRVRASSVNPADWVMLTGTPYLARPSLGLRRPKQRIPGKDMAGTVEAVGSAVTRVAVGDDVFAELAGGAYAEFVVTSEDRLVTMPPDLGFEEAAAMPVAGLTALQGLDKGGVRAGHKVLIVGASGGVGTYAVQIAKARGAEVTAVCRTRNLDLMGELGADHTIDYTSDDFADADATYDVIFDLVGRHRWSQYARVLADDGVLLACAGYQHGTVFGPLRWVVGLLARAVFTRRSVKLFVAEQTDDDMARLGDLVTAGQLGTAVDRRFALADVADALRHQGEGHARGKSVITIA